MNFKNLREVVKIRSRGQLTIPYNIREVLVWLRVNSVIEIVPKEKNRLELRPLVPFKEKKEIKKAKSQKDIKLLWHKMREIGKQGRQIKLSEFVIKDRMKH